GDPGPPAGGRRPRGSRRRGGSGGRSMTTLRPRPALRTALWLLAGLGWLASDVRAAVTAPSPSASPAPAPAAGTPDPRALTYAPLSISFPKPEKVFLPDGLLVYLFEDHELP